MHSATGISPCQAVSIKSCAMYFNVSGAMGDVSRNRVAAFPHRGAAGLRPAESARSSRRPHDVTAGHQIGQEKMRVALLKRETFTQHAQYRLGTLAFVDEPAPRSTRFAFAVCGGVARSHRARRRRSGRPNRRPHRAARARRRTRTRGRSARHDPRDAHAARGNGGVRGGRRATPRRAASARNRRVQPRLPCSVGICSNRLESQSTKSLSLAGTCRFGGYSTEIGRAGVLKPVRTSRNSPDFR